jgi:type IV pilus assembly protein PilW
MVEQVQNGWSPSDPAATTALPLETSDSTAYHATGSESGLTATLSGFGTDGEALDLGNADPASGTSPLFQLIGVKAGATSDEDYVLYSYDLLKINGLDEPTPIADQVFELHALYYVDTDATPDGKPDQWVSPDLSAAVHTLTINGTSYKFDAASLLDRSVTSADLLHRIKAIRVGLIVRSALRERDSVSQSSPTLFSDLGANFQYTSAAIDEHYRYKTFESTIPIRNNFD